jgi:hypothetical protein
MDQATPAQPQQELLEVTDIDTFVRHLTAWHASKIALLRHMVDMPEGTEFSVEDGPQTVLTGEVRVAFQTGIRLAISELENLPFEAMVSIDEADAPGEVAAAVTGTALVN